MRILVADQLAPEGAAWLRAQDDVEVTVKAGLGPDELVAELADHDGVVVRSAVQITGPILERSAGRDGSRLKAIARAGVGVDNIDVETATRLGIAVMNAASASTITTAEHAFALLIALARNIPWAHAAMSSGGWDRNKFIGTELHGKTLGVVGMGRIGSTLARRAMSFGMMVVGHDPYINAASALDGQVPLLGTLAELVGRCDFVSFHVPKTDLTAGMMGREAFAQAKRGIMVINASRGEIVSGEALLEALKDGRCGGAALDVYDTEPPPRDSPLRNHPRILTTPHLGASTTEAQEAVAVDACRAVVGFLRGEGMAGAVNAAGMRLDLTDRQRAFCDLGARMIALLEALAPLRRLERVRFTLRGETLAGRADTVARHALVELLRRHLSEPVTIINAAMIADRRNIDSRSVIASDLGDDRMSIEVEEEGSVRRVEGAIYADNLPRVTNLDGYAMDMVASGHMVLLTNLDEPGRIGLVGRIFGDAGANIAEMVIGRKHDAATGRTIAVMVLKLDAPPPQALLAELRRGPGILSASAVGLPG